MSGAKQNFIGNGESGDPECYPQTAKKSIKRVIVDRLWIVRESALLLRQTPADSKHLAGLMELPKLEDLPTVTKPKTNALLATKKHSISNQSIEAD